MALSEVAKNRKNDYKSNRPKPQKPQLLLASLRRKSVASLAREMTEVDLGLGGKESERSRHEKQQPEQPDVGSVHVLCRSALLNDRDGGIPKMDVFLPDLPTRTALCDEPVLGIVVVNGVALGIRLSDALTETVELVARSPDGGDHLCHPPAGVVADCI